MTLQSLFESDTELRPFSSLTLQEKLIAMLGHLRAPCDIAVVLDKCGINPRDLTENDLENVAGMFSAPGIEAVEVGGKTRYMLSYETRQELWEDIDENTVAEARKAAAQPDIKKEFESF